MNSFKSCRLTSSCIVTVNTGVANDNTSTQIKLLPGKLRGPWWMDIAVNAVCNTTLRDYFDGLQERLRLYYVR